MSIEISQQSIEKLTHDSEEIRLRALDQIETKFLRAQNHQLTLSLNPTILCTQLIRWFGYKPLKSSERVLQLLIKILETYGELIVKKIGVERLKCELCKVRKLIHQIPTESRYLDKIDHLIRKNDNTVLVSENENFACILQRLNIESNGDREIPFMYDSKHYEMAWSKPTTADYNSLKFMVDVLTNTQSINEELRDALEYLQVTMPDFPAEYMLQSPHVLVKLINLFEVNANLDEHLIRQIVKTLRIFLKALKQRLRVRRRSDSYSKQVCNSSKGNPSFELPPKSQLTIEKAMHLMMNSFLEKLQIEPLSTRTEILEIIEAFEDILKIINMQHLCIDHQVIVHTSRIMAHLKDICSEDEQYLTLARTRHVWVSFILHDMCELNAKRSQLYQYKVLKPHLCDYALHIYFPKRLIAIRKLIFSTDSEIQKSYEFLKIYEKRIRSCIVHLKQEDHQKAEDILFEAENMIPVLDTVQSSKLVKYIFKAILDSITLFPFHIKLKEKAAYILHQLLLLRHIPLKCDIYRGIALAVKKHFVALMNNVSYSDGITNQSLLSALILGVPLNMNILQQIIKDSYENENPFITQNAEDVLLLLLRSYHFYGSEWNSFLEILLPVLPLIQTYVNPKEISEVLIKILDPDSKHFPFIAILRGNITFMYSNDASVRSEALTRLVYMLNSLPQSSEYLPSVMEINDLLPNDICILKTPRDFRNIFAATESYYELPAMHNLLTLLDTPVSEPCIRKSALLQLDVICKNWDMTALFCEEHAHYLILRALENSLQKGSSADYVESIIPIISILTKLLICDNGFCKELMDIPNVYVLLLRAMFYYSQNIQVRQDAAVCLFLLVFQNNLIVNQEENTIEAPNILENLSIPLKCKFKFSLTLNDCDAVPSQLTNLFSSESDWKAYLRQVIIHSFCGPPISKKQIDQMHNLLDICHSLSVTQKDVRFLRSSDSCFMLRNFLRNISNTTEQTILLKTVNNMRLQLVLCYLECGNIELPVDIISSIFSSVHKYLQITPANSADFQVYTSILDMLRLSVRLSSKPIIRDFIDTICSNVRHGVFGLLKNSDLPMNVYAQISDFCCDIVLLSIHTESKEKREVDNSFRCNLFEFLYELTIQYNVNRKLQLVRCLLKILKILSTCTLNFPQQTLFRYSKSFLQLSKEIKYSAQTGTQWHRDCLLNFLQIFVQLFEEIRTLVSPRMVKHLIALCGHNDEEVCALAWSCLGYIANIEIKEKTDNRTRFQRGADFLTSELAHLPGGFLGSCLSTFLSSTEMNLVRNLAGNLFILLLNKVCTFENAINLLEMHIFFSCAHTSLETSILSQYSHGHLFSVSVTDTVNDPLELITCEMVTCYTNICIAILKLNPQFVEELCEKPLLFKLFEFIKLPLIKTNSSHFEMCANICKLYAICSKQNFTFLQRTLCHDECWLLCFCELLDIPENVSDNSLISVLQLLLVLSKEEFVYKIICKKFNKSLLTIQKISKRTLSKNKINTPVQRCSLAVISYLLIKSQQDYITLSSEETPHFSVILENEIELSDKINQLRSKEPLQKKVVVDDSNKENFFLNIVKEDYSTENKLIKTNKTTGTEKKSLSTLLFTDLFRIFSSFYPSNTCNFKFSPSSAKIQICETLALLLKLTPHARLAAKNFRFFQIILQILRNFFLEFNSSSTTFVRRYGEYKKMAVIKNFQILYSIILNWFSPTAAILTDEIDCFEFSQILIQTWSWLAHSIELKLLILKICSFLSEGSLTVCRQFSVIISSHDHSILQLVVKAVVNETHKIKTSSDVQLAIVNTGLRIMMNCSACTEGRFTMLREHVLDVLDYMYPINIKFPKIRNDLLNSWLEFWELFSRYSEGGKARNLNFLCAIINRTAPCTPTRLFSLKILRNMCFLSANRYQLMASSEFIYILNKITSQPFSIESSESVSFEEQLISSVSIWKLITGGIKYMAMIRNTKLSGELRILHEKLSNILTENSDQQRQWQFSVDLKSILDIIFNIFSE